MIWAWLFAVLASEPSDQTLIYYNARLALRADNPLEAVKLWLLRNTVQDHTGALSEHDPDFHSVTWAALGELGVCQDGHPRDDEGAGLWPLALHNWVVKNMNRRKPALRPRTFQGFQVGRQQRFVAIGDVLGAEDLDTVQLFRGRCSLPRLTMIGAGELPNAQLSDRQVAARTLRHLLVKAGQTLARDRVRGLSAIEARLFDLDLQLTGLAARAARKATRDLGLEARQLGMDPVSVEALKEEQPTSTLPPGSAAAQILAASVDWPVSEWMALSEDRRLFVFHHAVTEGGDLEKLDAVALGVIDALIARGDGEQVAYWIAQRGQVSADLEALWSGERGQRLLALDDESGFDERSVVALHRGVDHLERGELPEALRTFAFAMQHAPQSQASEAVDGLSRRWLSYVAAQFVITDELLGTLRELVTRRVYAVMLEDLLWRAAFRADVGSFRRGMDNQPGRGALARRAELLGPLAAGDVRRFLGKVQLGLRESPSETLRFLDHFVERIEAEDGEVRLAQLDTLRGLHTVLSPYAGVETGGRLGRSAGKLTDRLAAILEGLGDLGDEAAVRSVSPEGAVFVGSVRLAPSDPLPWPFRAFAPPAPAVFAPLELRPVEWTGDDGELVFGWSIEG